MFRYILYRLAAMIPVLLGVSLLVFSLFWVVPGDVVDIMTGDNSWGDPSAAEAVRKSLNLDKPFYVQYGLWLGKVLRGDFGVSFISGQNVLSEILQRIPVNFQMIAMAMFFIILIGIPVGILSAYRQFSWFDHMVRFATTLGYSIPNFWAATIVVLLGSVYFKWLPVLNYVPFSEDPLGNIKCMLLPGFVLGLSTLAFVTRLARSSFMS
jgi:peptide/nickel transport system permease protein